MKFCNESAMTWSSSDSGDTSGVVVGDGDGRSEGDVCLHFENVSLIELSRTSPTASGLHCGGGERRSIQDRVAHQPTLFKCAEASRLSRSPIGPSIGHEPRKLDPNSPAKECHDLTAVVSSVSSSNGYGARSMSEAEPKTILEDSNADEKDSESGEQVSVVAETEVEVTEEKLPPDEQPKDEEPKVVVEPCQEDKGAQDGAIDIEQSDSREKPDGASSDEGVNQESNDEECNNKKKDVLQGEEQTEDESPGDPPSPAPEPPKPKGILKRPGKEKHKNRVTFNELMTVFADGYPEVQVPAFRPWDLTDILCFAYEPPPGYRDWDQFDPPAEYMDLVEASMGVTTFHGDEDEMLESQGGTGEMIEIYRTEFEYSADAVEEMIFDGSSYMAGAGLESEESGPVTSFCNEESPIDESPSEPETVPEKENGDATDHEDANDNLSDEDLSAEDSQSDNHPTRHHGAVTDNEDSGPDSPDEPSSVESAIEKQPVAAVEPVEPESEALSTDKEMDSGDELGDGETSPKNVSSTTSQIRKSIEMNALRRSLLRGSDVCRRRTPGNQRPKSPTTSSLEEKLRWLTSTEDLTNAQQNDPQETQSVSSEDDVTAPLNGKGTTPARAIPRELNPLPEGAHFVIQPRPTRWASELLYSSSPASSASSASLSSGSNSSSIYETRQQLPSFRPPPTRPSSFDPTLGTLAWEGYLQRDRYGCGGSSLSLMRAPYVCTVERHPSADYQGPPGGPTRLKDPSNPTSDELEWFVARDLERIERIKKRYSLTEEEDPTFGFGRRPSVRGIRPRFGSTSEILQQLQSQMRPPRPLPLVNPKAQGPHPHVMVGPHRPNVAQCYPPGAHRVQHVQHMQPGGPHHRTVVVLPRVNEEGTAIPTVVRFKAKDDGLPNGCVSVNPKYVMNERGAPEGASSSPKVSSDSLYTHHQQHQQQQPGTQGPPGQNPKEGIIYYSLRV